jgi:hypothetical protein
VISADVDALDKDARTTIDYARKTYFVEKPFPMPVDAGPYPNIGELKPTGTFRKVAGHSCEEYTGSGDSAHFGHSDCTRRSAIFRPCDRATRMQGSVMDPETAEAELQFDVQP